MSILNHAPVGFQLRDYQQKVLLEVEAKWDRADVIILDAPVGCHEENQMVLKADGTIVKIKDIVVGDRLLGPDGSIRNVLGKKTGYSKLYRTTPLRGESYLVTDDHVWPVKRIHEVSFNKQKVVTFVKDEFTVAQMLKRSRHMRDNTRLYSAEEFEYPSMSTPDPRLPPYILGTWLGDGTSRSPTLTNMDEEILNEWKKFATDMQLRYHIYQKKGTKAKTLSIASTRRNIPNTFRKALVDLNLIQNKHIPMQYLTMSIENRWELLAGIIDTDGSVGKKTKKGPKNSVELTLVNEVLFDNVLQLVRSLGLSVSKKIKPVNGKNYYRMHISGNLKKLPLRLTYKRELLGSSTANMKNRKFDISADGYGNWIGLQVDQDHLFLLGDFTVTHNCGKSVLAMTIANWCNSSQTSAVVTTPRVALQDQYLRDWPNLPTLKGMAHYHCKDMDTDCASAYEILEERCNNCPYSKAKDRVIAAPTGLYNIHSCIFLYNGRNPNTPKLKDVIIIDEAHTLFSTLSGMYEISLWKHLENYPDEMETIGDVHAFLQRRVRELENEVESLKGGSTNDKKEAIKIKQKVDKFYRIMDGISKSPSNFFIQKDQEMYYGRMRDLLKIRPQDLSGLPPLLWGNKQKIVLMTGTWNAQDIKMLGLSNKRVTTVFVDNPIPPEQRPIVIPQGLNMSREYQDKNLPAMAKLIEEIRKQHNSKGVVHITYPLAEKLSKYLNGSNYLYHTADNSSEVLQQFLASKDKVVMVACGMTTGLDLVGEDYQWQVIAKIPYPSLGDPLVRKWLQDSPDWYRWLSVSQVLQAVGRICRGPKDYGVTYILDNTAGTLDGKRLGLLKRAGSMLPKYFKEAVRYG